MQGEVDAGSRPSREFQHEQRSAELEQKLARALARIAALETQLASSRSQVAWLSRQVFGRKRDPLDRDALEKEWLRFLKSEERKARGQAPLEPREDPLPLVLEALVPSFVDPPDAPKGSPAPETDAPPVPPAPPPKRKRHAHGRGRPEIAAPRWILEPEQVPEGARRVGEETSVRWAYQRARLVPLLIVRPRYLSDDEYGETHTTIARPPKEMMARASLAPSALAFLLASRFRWQLPWNRLEAQCASLGQPLARSTMSGVAIRAAPLAKKLVETMERDAKLRARSVGIDASGVLLRDGPEPGRGHVWIRFVEGIAVFANFTKTHDGAVVEELLAGWHAPTVADGASVYDAHHRQTRRARAGCAAHARRKFCYAAVSDPRAMVGVKLLNELFAIEATLLSVTDEERLAARQARSKPVFERLCEWQEKLSANPDVSPRSLLGRALGYLSNQRARLAYFLEDARVPIHNNATELRIRHIAVGRKNWLFVGSMAAAEAAGTWFTLVLSAMLFDLDVELYLRDLCRVLPSWPEDRLLELAPERWLATRGRLDPAQLAEEYGPLDIPPAQG
jgi:transposase